MNIIKDLTRINFRKLANKNNKYIVIHYVGAVNTAKNNGTYFRNIDRKASAHYFVDNNDIVQVVEDENEAWHCGSTKGYKHKDCRNSNSIGIEICCYKIENGDEKGKIKMLPEALELSKELVRKLIKDYNIPKENVLRHYDVTGKDCPMEWQGEVCEEWENYRNSLFEVV